MSPEPMAPETALNALAEAYEGAESLLRSMGTLVRAVEVVLDKRMPDPLTSTNISDIRELLDLLNHKFAALEQHRTEEWETMAAGRRSNGDRADDGSGVHAEFARLRNKWIVKYCELTTDPELAEGDMIAKSSALHDFEDQMIAAGPHTVAELSFILLAVTSHDGGIDRPNLRSLIERTANVRLPSVPSGLLSGSSPLPARATA